MHERRSRPRRFTTGARTISLALCLCAGQLVAVPAVAAAPATAPTAGNAPTAAAAAARAKPRVQVTGTRLVGWNATARMTAVVTNPRTGGSVASGSVRLDVLTKGKWRAWQTRRVAAGRAVFAPRLRAVTTFRAVYLGNPSYAANTSAGIRIRVKPSNAKVINLAQRLKGSPYRFGASGPRAFDCSGFTQYVYRAAVGRKLPHKAHTQQRYGRAISKSKAQPGDLIIVRTGSYGYHAGVYAGNGYIYDSPRAGLRVGKHKLWTRSYVVRRLVA